MTVGRNHMITYINYSVVRAGIADSVPFITHFPCSEIGHMHY